MSDSPSRFSDFCSEHTSVLWLKQSCFARLGESLDAPVTGGIADEIDSAGGGKQH
jgi:hypothetical protein